jgi:hypothetical protein
MFILLVHPESKSYLLNTDVCCLSVWLNASFSNFCLFSGPYSSKYAGINEANNDVLTCQKFHLFCLDNTFKCKKKTKTKNEVQLWLHLTFHHQERERPKKVYYLFPNSRPCSTQLVAVWTSSYVTLFTTLTPA